MIDQSRHPSRRLAAIMFTDMVGFSRMTHENPTRARALNEEHQQIIRKCLQKHNGLERQTTGDGFFAEFSSAIEALQAGIEIQQALHDRNMSVGLDQKISIRIGLHAGEIFEKNNEIYGDVVNTASRMEPLANVGGICMSENFFNLVQANWQKHQFTSLGSVPLKNISENFKIYKFNFTWEAPQTKKITTQIRHLLRSMTENFKWPAYLVYLSTFAVFAAILIQGLSPAPMISTGKNRTPSSTDQGFKSQALDHDWMYSLKASAPDHFQEFIPQQSWKYADLLHESYTLKNEFVLQGRPQEPAIILGLVPDQHRVFLNGQLIGGTNHVSELGVYVFDPQLLKNPPEKNTLIINSEGGPSLNPGLNFLSEYPPQLGEMTDLQKMQSSYFTKFYVLKNIYFSFSLFIFAFSLAFALFLKNKDEFFYSSLFLLLGVLHLAYYNPWVNSRFDYTFLRYLKVNSIFLSSLVLTSGILASSKRVRALKLNNLFGLVLCFALLLFFNLTTFESSKEFVSAYNQLLAIGMIYTAVLAGVFLVSSFTRSDKKTRFSQELMFSVFLALHVFNYLAAFKNGITQDLFSSSVRTAFADFGIALPFLYAITKASVSVVEFLIEKKRNEENRQNDEILLQISKLISETDTGTNQISQIHTKSFEHLKALRSSIYLIDHNKLVLSSRLGDSRLTRTELDLKGNIFSYALENGRPLLIGDMSQDFRFKSEASSSESGFESGSCILIPLYCQGNIIGILSFSDKENESEFSKNDLRVAVKIGTLLSLVLANDAPQKNVSSLAS